MLIRVNQSHKPSFRCFLGSGVSALIVVSFRMFVFSDFMLSSIKPICFFVALISVFRLLCYFVLFSIVILLLYLLSTWLLPEKQPRVFSRFYCSCSLVVLALYSYYFSVLVSSFLRLTFP